MNASNKPRAPHPARPSHITGRHGAVRLDSHAAPPPADLSSEPPPHPRYLTIPVVVGGEPLAHLRIRLDVANDPAAEDEVTECIESVRSILARRIDAASEPAIDLEAEVQARPHAAAIVALDSHGWRVVELRPSSHHGPALWIVTIERTDFCARMTMTAPDPDLALEELVRYAAADADALAS